MDEFLKGYLIRYEFGLSLVNLSLIHAKLPDADKLPGELPRLAKAMDEAKTSEQARMAASAFLIASEEWI